MSTAAPAQGELRWALHGAVLAILGGAVAAASPEAAATVARVVGLGLMGIAAVLVAIDLGARRRLDRRQIARSAITVLGFAGAGLLSYLAIGWLPVAILVTIAVVVAGWGALQRPRAGTRHGAVTGQ